MVRGGPTLDFGPAGWGWLVALALVSTVGAIVLFFAGLARVGPSVASILSVLEPVVTVGLAARGLRGVADPRSSCSAESSSSPPCSSSSGPMRG